MKKNNKKGFTLVELVIVVAVMAVLVAVAIPTVSSITGTAKTAVQNSNARTIESMLKLAEADKAKTGDGTATLSSTEIDAALTAAKLGIDEGTFVYNPTKGTVVVGTTAASGEFLITLDSTPATGKDEVEVTAGGGSQDAGEEGEDEEDDG